MRKLVGTIMTLAVALTLALAPCAWGIQSASEVGELSSRYNSLNKLEGSSDTSDNVVTDTRVGVLTSVNRALDGSTVRFTGEAVGDIVKGGKGHKWVNVLGADGSCIGVYVTDEMAERVVNLGMYGTTGSTLEIRGVYSFACDEHQDELDVHAVSIQVLDAGGSVEYFYDRNDVLMGLALCGVGLALLMAFFVARHLFDRIDLEESKDRSNRGSGLGRAKRRSDR